LKHKQVDYNSNEIGIPHKLTSERVPGLPSKGVAASLPAEQLSSGFVRDAPCNPNLVLKGEKDVEMTQTTARVWAEDEDWCELAQAACDLGILGEHPKEDGAECSVGAFGVEKAYKLVQRKSGLMPALLRLVVNLIPTNALCRTIQGGTVGQWHAISPLEYEILLWSSADRRCFFYICAVPCPWWKYWSSPRGPLRG
jgi:hypothetical protein